jgi:hypothetical protein
MRDPSKYVIGGIRWPSVTEVLHLAGLVDYSAIREEVLENARERGRDVHAYLHGVEMGVLGGLTPDPRVQPYVDGYSRFRDDKKFEILTVEQVVINETHQYAGMLDRTGMMDGSKTLLDLKAVAKVQPESALQTAGYGACLEEPHKRAVLQLHPDLPRGYKLHPYTSRNDLHDFLSAVRIAWCKIRWGRARIGEEKE